MLEWNKVGNGIRFSFGLLVPSFGKISREFQLVFYHTEKYCECVPVISVNVCVCVCVFLLERSKNPSKKTWNNVYKNSSLFSRYS